jgi:hypothetical protein
LFDNYLNDELLEYPLPLSRAALFAIDLCHIDRIMLAADHDLGCPLFKAID